MDTVLCKWFIDMTLNFIWSSCKVSKCAKNCLWHLKLFPSTVSVNSVVNCQNGCQLNCSVDIADSSDIYEVILVNCETSISCKYFWFVEVLERKNYDHYEIINHHAEVTKTVDW